MSMQEIGKFIAALRKDKNMTQADLAKTVHVTVQAVSKWECGKGLPQINLLLPLSDALGVSATELLNGSRMANHNEQNIEQLFIEYGRKREEEVKTNRNKLRKRIAVLSLLAAFIIAITIFIMMHVYIPLSYGSDKLGTICLERGKNNNYFLKMDSYRNELIQHKIIHQNADNSDQSTKILYIHAEVTVWDYLFSSSDYSHRYSLNSNDIDAVYYASSRIDDLSETDYSNAGGISIVWNKLN